MNINFPTLIINGLSVIIKPAALRGEDIFVPSEETLQQWYIAHYGVDLFDLPDNKCDEAVEAFSRWWEQLHLPWIEACLDAEIELS